MPYIRKLDRQSIAVGRQETNPGELNYSITQLLIRYIENNGLSYQSINDVLGALEGSKQEFYRRVAAPYEDKKIKENGDVYSEGEEK
jgi:hypothetical protein